MSRGLTGDEGRRSGREEAKERVRKADAVAWNVCRPMRIMIGCSRARVRAPRISSQPNLICHLSLCSLF